MGNVNRIPGKKPGTGEYNYWQKIREPHLRTDIPPVWRPADLSPRAMGDAGA